MFARAAREAGATRIIFLGGLVPTDEKLSEHPESRADVGDALGDAGVDLVWLRTAVILGAGSTSYELIHHIDNRVPVIPIPTWMNYVVSPVAVDDVLRYFVAAADATVLAGCFDISSDDRPTYAELFKAHATRHGLRRIWLPFLPIWPALVARDRVLADAVASRVDRRSHPQFAELHGFCRSRHQVAGPEPTRRSDQHDRSARPVSDSGSAARRVRDDRPSRAHRHGPRMGSLS